MNVNESSLILMMLIQHILMITQILQSINLFTQDCISINHPLSSLKRQLISYTRGIVNKSSHTFREVNKSISIQNKDPLGPMHPGQSNQLAISKLHLDQYCCNSGPPSPAAAVRKLSDRFRWTSAKAAFSQLQPICGNFIIECYFKPIQLTHQLSLAQEPSAPSGNR